MNALEMAEAMEGRARVRRKITNRENTGDRLSDQLEQAATMLRTLDGQLAFRIDAVTKYQAWVKELEISKQSWETIAKGYSKTIDEQQAEIEALKVENRVLRKGELWLGMVYNNRGNGIAPMYLENFMSFCETNGFTEESGYKLLKAQEK